MVIHVGMTERRSVIGSNDTPVVERADWTSDEAFALNRGEFELTSQERATAADRLWMDLACHARVQEASSC